ncbi:Psf2-domain-containing protein [Microstroma glucosiphilum]|uniref:DNA replication complex GINS protein PSF2 n=1 Tax=Pseudomicrostroma glucosiphilum TaxID=1684307 RepID=A0A316U639_9BASI|nr:Psf2-domain-containing protein [Pseudomicrostroma glucosiphilum]PWN20727.1 Psf2-domain-containing protein [Pseudomicrostroma glucosiphilum]
MALPLPLQSGLLPSEIEYLATSSTTISIVPLTSIDRARFLSGVYGPFRPPARTTVPLWLALNLKRKGKCYLVVPEWMMAENLSKLLQTETTTLAFAEVPFHYASIAKVILEVAPDDVPEADEVRAMLKDLREARQSKIAQGLDMINPYHLEMTNISYSELCELRPFFSTAFTHLRGMRIVAPPPADAAGDDFLGDFSASSYPTGTPRRTRAGGGGAPRGGYGLEEDSLPSDFSYNSMAGQGRTSMPGRGEDDDDDDGMGVAQWGGVS